MPPLRVIIIFILVVLFLLFLRFFIFYQNFSQYQDGQSISLQVTLMQEPKVSNHGQRFTIKTSENQRIAIQSGLSPRYHYGDRLAIQGSLQVDKNEKGQPFFSLRYPKIGVLTQSQNPFFKASVWVREKSSRLFYETLSPVSASLLMGILFGAKEDFPPDFWEDLQTTGVLHVIAASGMNVTFFTGAVMFSLGTFLKRRIAILLSIFAVIFYAFLAGMDPPILRASIMGLIAFAASFLGKQSFAFLSLFIAGFVLLLWQPAYLFDVGFQLSCLATLAILLFNPGLKWLDKLGMLGEDIKTTISAQLGTLPILLGVFGKIGVWSILVNALVLWTIPLLMILGSLAVLGGLIFMPLGKIFLLFSLPFLLFFEYIVRTFASLGGELTMESFPWQLGVGYYLILSALIFHLISRKSNTKTRQE